MVDSPVLGIPEIQDTNTPEVEANGAVNILEAAANSTTNLAVAASPHVVLAASYNRFVSLRFTNGGIAAAFNVLVPSTNPRLFVVRNASGQVLTIGVNNGSGGFLGTTVEINDGQDFIVYSDATNLIAVGGGGGLSEVSDEGVAKVIDAVAIDFIGNGVTVTDAGAGVARISVPGFNGVSPAAPFFGALARPTADVAAANLTAGVTSIAVATEVHQTKYKGWRFHLGPNATVTADAGLDQITLTAHGFITGDGPFEFSNSGGGLPAGLTAATQYWAIVTGTDTFKVATSLANALAGTAVDITSAGTGTHTCVRNDRLVVPSGVLKVRLSGQVHLENFAVDGDISVRIDKNGSGGAATIGMPYAEHRSSEGFINSALNLSSGVIAVAPGDRFRLAIIINGDTSVDVNSEGTWLALEVVETDEDLTAALVGSPGPFKYVSTFSLAGLSLKEIPVPAGIIAMQLRVQGVTVSTDAAVVLGRIKKNGAIKSDANYHVASQSLLSNDTENFSGSETRTSFPITLAETNHGMGNAVNEVLDSIIEVEQPNSARVHHITTKTSYTVEGAATTREGYTVAASRYVGTDLAAVLEAIEISVSTGTFVAGTVQVYALLASNPVAAPGGTPGPWRFLAHHVLSASTGGYTISDFAGLTQYKKVRLEFVNMRFGTDLSRMDMRLTKNASLKTAGYNVANDLTRADNATAATNVATNDTFLRLGGDIANFRIGNAAGEALHGWIDINDPAGTVRTTIEGVVRYHKETGNIVKDHVSGGYVGTDDTAALDSVLLYAGEGAHTLTGDVYVYGLLAEEPMAHYTLSSPFLSGAPAASQVVLSHRFARNVDAPLNFAGSQFIAGVAATASTAFDVQKNGASVGTLTFAIAGTVATFSVNPAVSFAPGDLLRVIAPGTPDATLANLDITLAFLTAAVD